MKYVRCFAIVLPIAFAMFGCGRKESTRVLSPSPPPAVDVAEAHWVTDKAALEGAVHEAAASPLVARAIQLVPQERLNPLFHLAVRGVGTMTDGMHVGVTILPYMVGDDSTHATFISYLDGYGSQVVDIGEIIAGREPTALETGYYPTQFAGRLVWVKDGDAANAFGTGSAQLSPERVNWARFAKCFFDGAPSACLSGSQIADEIAPGIPRAAAIGCAVGVASLAVMCAGSALR